MTHFAVWFLILNVHRFIIGLSETESAFDFKCIKMIRKNSFDQKL